MSKRTVYNKQIEVTFALKDKRDKLLAEYYRADQDYNNAIVIAKLMDEKIDGESGGDTFVYPHKFIDNQISNDFITIKDDK